MANVNELVPKILKWEGGFQNMKEDTGNYLDGKLIGTNKGITPGTYKQVFGKTPTVEDMKNITDAQFMVVLKKFYWDRWKADQINNQSIANILVDWVWASGKWGIVHPQRVLGVTGDGIVGNNTLNAINNYPDQYELFIKIYNRRKQHFESVATKGSNQKFLKGWLNRLADYTYK